ncbi:hypothetical protein IJO12_01540 [bacterium]|nr:hypothetical protein [bacterium]
MSKKDKTIFETILTAFKLYFSNFSKFINYMTFPVLGSLTGFALIFSLLYVYSKNIPSLIQKFEILNNYNVLFFFTILVTLPGLVIFLKACWEYLIAYGAVNSMYDNMRKSGKVYDFNAHTELIKRRIFSFIGLWTLVGLFWMVGFFPLFWVPAAVLGIFFILIFQIFTFEPNLSPINCFRKSLYLIKGHFAQTFILLVLITFFTYFLLPQLFVCIFEKIGFTNILSSLISPLLESYPVQEINEIFSAYCKNCINIKTLSNIFAITIISYAVIQYTLPLRSILWCVWYDNLNKNYTESNKKTNKTSKKNISKKTNLKPSEKLMIESNKKFSSKKIDNNILKRAMEKDD